MDSEPKVFETALLFLPVCNVILTLQAVSHILCYRELSCKNVQADKIQSNFLDRSFGILIHGLTINKSTRRMFEDG